MQNDYQVNEAFSSYVLPDGDIVTANDLLAFLDDCDKALKITGLTCASSPDISVEVRRSGYAKTRRLRQMLANIRCAVNEGAIVVRPLSV